MILQVEEVEVEIDLDVDVDVGVNVNKGFFIGMELCLTIYCCYLDTSKSFFVRRFSALEIELLIKTFLYCWV